MHTASSQVKWSIVYQGCFSWLHLRLCGGILTSGTIAFINSHTLLLFLQRHINTHFKTKTILLNTIHSYLDLQMLVMLEKPEPNIILASWERQKGNSGLEHYKVIINNSFQRHRISYFYSVIGHFEDYDIVTSFSFL